MARSRSLLAVLGLLLSVAALQGARAADDATGVDDDEYGGSERAHLVVRKFIANAIPAQAGPNPGAISGLVVQGRNVTISVDIYNAGTSTANNVVLKDTLPENATLVEGSVGSEVVGKVTAGSHVKHSYTVVFTSGNSYSTLPLAIASYSADSDSDKPQESMSTLYAFFVMTPVQQIQRYALKVGSYASLGFAKSASDWRNLAILVGIISTAVGANWASKRVKAAGVNRRREKALKELEKSD